MCRNPLNRQAWQRVEFASVAWMHCFDASKGSLLSSERLGDVFDLPNSFTTGGWQPDGSLFAAGIEAPRDGNPAVTTLRWPAGEFVPGLPPRVHRREFARPFTNGACNYFSLPDGRVAGSGEDESSGEAVWWVAVW